MPPHVQHAPVTTASEGKPLELTVSFTIAGGAAVVSSGLIRQTLRIDWHSLGNDH